MREIKEKGLCMACHLDRHAEHNPKNDLCHCSQCRSHRYEGAAVDIGVGTIYEPCLLCGNDNPDDPIHTPRSNEERNGSN